MEEGVLVRDAEKENEFNCIIVYNKAAQSAALLFWDVLM